MGKVARTVVIAVGLTAAVSIWAMPPTGDGTTERLAQLSRIAAEGTRGLRPAEGVSRVETPPKQTSVAAVATVDDATLRHPKSTTVHEVPPLKRVTSQHEPRTNAFNDRSAEEGPVRKVEAAPLAPSTVSDTGALVRMIQLQLRRIGCLSSQPDGIWSAPTRQAMGTFLSRINARLPVSEPDDILLTLLEGQNAGACRAACQEGHARWADGQCHVAGAANARITPPPMPIVAPLVRVEETKAQKRIAALAAARDRQHAALVAREARLEARRRARHEALVQRRRKTVEVREAALRQKQIARELAEARRKQREADAPSRADRVGMTTAALPRSRPAMPTPAVDVAFDVKPRPRQVIVRKARHQKVAQRPRTARRAKHEGRRFAGRFQPPAYFLGRSVAAPRTVHRPSYVARPMRASLRVRIFSQLQNSAP